MSQDAPWVGVTPDPPTQNYGPSSCNKQIDCPSEMHHSGCARVRTEVLDRITKETCARDGHYWSIQTAGTLAEPDVPVSIFCDNGCGARYKVVPY
jgi:hypothetical protein